MNKALKILIASCAFIGFMALLLLAAYPLIPLFTQPEKLREIIEGFGVFAPVVFAFLVAAQVFFAPIPGQVAGAAGGYLFGTVLGTLYSMLGLIIGSSLAFLLAKKLGEPLVEKFVDPTTLKKFNSIVEKRGMITLFFLYLLPAIPDDALCYIAGLTKMNFRAFLAVSTLGRLPGFLVLNAIGDGIASSSGIIIWIIFGFIMIFSLIVFLNMERLEKAFVRLTERIRNQASPTR